MKILKISAKNYKGISKTLSLEFTSKSRKTSEDLEYELQRIDENLYTFNTIAFVGKNASGKTTVVELINLCLQLFATYRITKSVYDPKPFHLDIVFYHEGYVYNYVTDVLPNNGLSDTMVFSGEELVRKKYNKNKHKTVLDNSDMVPYSEGGELPNDVSQIYHVFRNDRIHTLYFGSEDIGKPTFAISFELLSLLGDKKTILNDILHIFDDETRELEQVNEKNYILTTGAGTLHLTDVQLMDYLSSGTNKGLLLYTFAAVSLCNGYDLVVDEIENHFHKSLVDNLIMLYKDKRVNRNNATLYFTTHNALYLDTFNRRDNIWVVKNEDGIQAYNMYSYKVRQELSKSKRFYDNTFGTAVNYETLMRYKKDVLK